MSGAGKQPQKNEDNPNLSKVKEKVQRLFGFGKASAPPTLPKTSTREIVFTTEILKEIGPESPANNRLKRIREMCEVVKVTRLEENAVEALWGQIRDLLQPQVLEDTRHLALRFLHCLLEGQLDYITIVRGHFFRVIQNLTDPADAQYRLQLFDTLSECGKNLLYFENETGDFLLTWMPELMSSGYVMDFLPIIINVIKYNAAYVDEEVMAGLVQQTCMIPNRFRSDEELMKCLCVLDAVICYSYLPSNCLHHFVAALCHTVDKQPFSEKSWELMRKLLGTYLGHSAIFTMCCILQDKRQPVDVVRGAIFFTGMALWGSRRVSTLKHSHSSVLPSFYKALSHENTIVAYEVVLNLQRLVNKYGKDLQHVTWETGLDILETLLTQIEKCGFEKKVSVHTHQVITSIESLYSSRQFFGPTARLFGLVEMCASRRPSSSVCALIDYKTQFINPCELNWIESLNMLMEKYLKQETRTEVRKKALEVLSLVLSINTHVYERELIECIVLPHFSQFDLDPDPEVRCQAVDLLLGLCEDCQHADFFELAAIVEKIIRKPLVNSCSSSNLTTDNTAAVSERREDSGGGMMTLTSEEAGLVDVRMAVTRIIEVFKTKLYCSPAPHCQRLYQLLICHLELQYSHLYLGRLACALRKSIFDLLLALRADSRSRLGLSDRKPGERHVYSPYVMCRDVSEDLGGGGGAAAVMPPGSGSSSQMYSFIEYQHTFKLFLRALETERDWSVLHTVLLKMPHVLENKTLVLSACGAHGLLDVLCGKLCAMVRDRTVEQSKKLINRPPNFSRSDFHACVFPVLASMVTYHGHLDRTRQRELVTCLEFGLVSKCAKICVTTLRICSLEMQDLMMRMLPSVLLSLSKISATISMAIPVLAFLSSVVRIPKLYANFVEDQYMSVFAIALPYTNPFKFSHYTVSLAHHVIGIWFIRCRLPFRRGFVKYIQRGLKYNVLQLFEENSIRHLSQNNQDSSDRGRTTSLNEGNRGRRRNITEAVRNDGRIPMDEKMSQFHKELTETCVDMMARYAYGNFTALPKRSPMAEFLLKDGQRGVWCVGNKVITITTSGGAAKSDTSGLCDKCLATYLNSPDTPVKPVKRSAPIATGSESRRRHKSMAALGRSHTQGESMGISSMSEERRSRDDMSLPMESSLDIFGNPDTGAASARDSQMSDSHDILASGQGRQSEGKSRTFSSAQCSCWCTSWAEVKIRGASGVVCWMMRIENESSSRDSFSSDPSAPDITQLLAPPRCKTPDSDSLHSLGKIDSGSLCEEEYETLHSQHFSTDTDSHGVFPHMQQEECSGGGGYSTDTSQAGPHQEVPGPPPTTTTDTPAATPATNIPLELQSPSSLRRISSSPSVLSGSRDSALSARELMQQLVECTEERRRSQHVTSITTTATVEALGSPARREAQDFTHATQHTADTQSDTHSEDARSATLRKSPHADAHSPRTNTNTDIDEHADISTTNMANKRSNDDANAAELTTGANAEMVNKADIASSDSLTDSRSDGSCATEASEREKCEDSGSWVITELEGSISTVMSETKQLPSSKSKSFEGNTAAAASSSTCKTTTRTSDLSRKLSQHDRDESDEAKVALFSVNSGDSISALSGGAETQPLAEEKNQFEGQPVSQTVTQGMSQPLITKRPVHRTQSEDVAGLRRPEALKLPQQKQNFINKTEEDLEESSASSSQDEVPELRQLTSRPRGHTISVMGGGRADAEARLQQAVGPKDSKEGLSPSYVFLQLYQSHPLVHSVEVPLKVPDDPKFKRTIDMLDHIYPYETHKIGVLYMRKGQSSDEKNLLANEFGSPRYTEFIQGLGDLVSIEQAERDKIYLGGLTPSDGKFTVTWNDESLRVIFHIATLMPSLPGDTRYNNKKRHIGNDFVTIVYNDSSEDYKSGTISGQFNFVSIIIRPLDHESNAVSLITKEDIADILGHTHTKIISDTNLPLLVRQIAVHCNLASMVLQRQQSTIGSPEVFASNWLERLRQIKLLRRRIQEFTMEDVVGGGAGVSREPVSPSHIWPPPGANGDISVTSGCEDFTDYL